MRFVCCLLLTAAAAAAHDSEPVVEVFLPTVPGSMNTALARARGVVEKIYGEIGVRVIWRSATWRHPDCSKTPLHRSIRVALTDKTLAGMSRSARAYSYPYATDGPCVLLLMDRLQADVRMNPVGGAFLLGHVLAHEMGHVLQGISRHSEAGIMKARWSTKETTYLWTDSLHFSRYDAELILESLTGANKSDSNGKTVPKTDVSRLSPASAAVLVALPEAAHRY